ncbi:hypothetical protein BDQ17DRAFT_1370371 [Cyathus striatus]|nr:hypothetical protein BDQ17DRAFT_1370371 [Cyathus striatus]
MALSVSGFPEPSRSPASTESSPDDPHKNNLMNSPRLRSLFGKKPDSSRMVEGPAVLHIHPPPPPYHLPPPLFHRADLHAPARGVRPHHPHAYPLEPRSIMAKRPQPATALTRLDIGALSKQHQHALPKLPPSVVVEEWSTYNKEKEKEKEKEKAPVEYPSSPPRPLPHPPLPAEASRHVHVNAVAGPSRLPHTHTQTPAKVPAGSMRARSHSRSRIQPQGKVTAGMRYQALSVEPSEKLASASQSGRSSSNVASGSNATVAAAAVTSPVRPLPTLPAPTPVSAILRTAPYIPPTPRIKRPRTSRSVFDASRPIDLNASQHHKPAQPKPKPKPKLDIRTQNPSSTSSEHSADSYLGKQPPPRIQTKVNLMNRPLQRTAPSPVVGARPMPSPRSAPATPPPKLTILTTGAVRRAPRSPPSSSGTASASKSLDTLASAYTTYTPYTPVDEEVKEDAPPLHSHPVDAFFDLETETEPEPEQEEVLDSPLEVSPSPITYARPNSRGTVVSSSPTATRLRTQPRSYRNSYRHPKPVSEELLSPAVEKRRTQPRSFQYDPAGMRATPPGSRPASQERRSRSRQPVNKGKKDKDKEKQQSKSRSPRRKFRSVPAPPPPPTFDYEPFVLDISSAKPPSLPSLREIQRPGTGGSGSSGGSSKRMKVGILLDLLCPIGGLWPEGEFDPYVHGASCGIGMLRSAEVSNSSGIFASSGSSVGSRKDGRESGGERDRERDRGGRRHTQIVQQQQQRQRVNSTTGYEEFFSSLRRKEQKVDRTGEDMVVTALQSRKESHGWREEGKMGVLKTKRSR